MGVLSQGKALDDGRQVSETQILMPETVFQIAAPGFFEIVGDPRAYQITRRQVHADGPGKLLIASRYWCGKPETGCETTTGETGSLPLTVFE